MKKILLFCFYLLFVSCKKECQEEKKKCEPNTSKKLEMYQMSEMASLMEQMYVESKRTKEQIEKGESPKLFPEYFLKIYTAKFTDDSDNDIFFKEKAKEFITTQQLIYSDSKNAISQFNSGVDACIKCHESKCGGPIPRIKKLYIK